MIPLSSSSSDVSGDEKSPLAKMITLPTADDRDDEDASNCPTGEAGARQDNARIQFEMTLEEEGETLDSSPAIRGRQENVKMPPPLGGSIEEEPSSAEQFGTEV